MIGDIGHRTRFHVGDEAMFEAAIGGGGEWIAVSADPAHTTERTGVAAVPGLGFPAGRDEADARERRLRLLLDGGPPAGDPARETLAALERSRALLVAGGGNLSSTWPELLYERVALIELAARRGLPVVVTGQTIGPELQGRERELLANALAQAALVGVRERDSCALARELGVAPGRLTLQLDDAIFLPGEPGTRVPPSPWIAATFPSAAAERWDLLAHELADLSRATGAEVVLIPHEGSLHDGALVRDVRSGEELERRIARAGAAVRRLPLAPPATVAALTRRADLVVAARYHPLVFGLGGGVPCLGVHVDEYTRTKLRGALAHAGLEGWSLPLPAAERLADAALELWERRDELRAHLESLLPAWRNEAAAHRARVERALAGRPPGAPAPELSVAGPQPAGSWARDTAIVDRLTLSAERERRAMARHVAALERSFEHAQRYAASLREHLDRANGVAPAPTITPPLRLSDLRHEQVGDAAVASMLVEGGAGPSGRVHLRRHGAGLDQIDRSATPFAPIAAILALPQGVDAEIDGPVDEVVRSGAQAGAALLAQWFGWRAPAIGPAEQQPAGEPAAQRALFLSRGLDSMASFARQRSTLDALIGMAWEDPPYRSAGTDAVWRGTVAAAAEAGLPLVKVSTDARLVTEPVLAWDFTYGAVLSSLALLLAPTVGTALLAGAFPEGHGPPNGGHPDVIRGWSSSRVAIETEFGGGGRNEKAAIVGADPFCLRWLNVCWEHPGERNCGRCCKCLLTMTNFKIAGCLEQAAAAFDAELTPEAVLGVALDGTPTTPMNGRLVLERLAADDPLRPAWERMLEVALERDAATAREAAAELDR